MKTKMKKISVLGLAVCAVVAGTCIMSACGGGNKYESYKPADWQSVTYEQWDAKDISYQIEVNALSVRTSMVLINLYSDGTVLSYQSVCANSDSFDWLDADNHVAFDFYGLWEESNDVITIHYYGASLLLTQDASKGGNPSATVSMAEGWQAEKDDDTNEWVQNKFTYSIQLKKSGSDYVLEEGLIYTYFLNNSGTGFQTAAGGTATTGSAIKYNTLQKWFDSYMAGADDFTDY